LIKKNQTGICGVRKNDNGKLYSLIYESCSSLSIDPIEKKPLYHFFPGTNVFSVGTVGCNFKCMHCQNFSISTGSPIQDSLREVSAEKLVSFALSNKCQGVAWTYNEPTIWYEYTYDSARIAKKSGLYTVYVTNGYIQEGPLKEISPFLDAMNIDIKSFSEGFYSKVCKAKLEPVKETCILSKELGIHIELTYLVIPGYNDSLEEVKNFCLWVVENLGSDVPVHFSRFHPDYKMQHVKVTPFETLYKIYELAKKLGICYIYLGNVPGGEFENTICPKCGNVCIERSGFSIDLKGIASGKCSKCGHVIEMII
jgi:pyruvate formate lyase activating enzyme